MDYPWKPLGRFIARKSGSVSFRRTIHLTLDRPIISFTFDDFPRSALFSGGEILQQFGVGGTYYTALGLLGMDSPSGPLFQEPDLKAAIENGHELGCHTYAHYDSWDTAPGEFERSVIQNRDALKVLLPGQEFQSFSYPISSPRPLNKRAVAKFFQCCRGGGQTNNVGVTDLNQLAAYFLEKAAGDLRPVKDLIKKNRTDKGWIIFATHDVAAKPGPYGCTPDYFKEVLQCSIDSGATVLPVVKALEAILGSNVR